MLDQRVGRCVVIKFRGIGDRYALWECRCDCGTRFVTNRHLLQTGLTKSCGCLRREKSAATMRRIRRSGR